MKTNVERIVDFLKKYDIDESVFEKKAGLGNAAIQNNLKNNGKFTDKSLEKILKAFPDIRREWLYFGWGAMLKSEMPEDANKDLEPSKDDVIKKLPELKWPPNSKYPNPEYPSNPTNDLQSLVIDVVNENRQLNEELKTYLKEEITRVREVKDMQIQVIQMENKLKAMEQELMRYKKENQG